MPRVLLLLPTTTYRTEAFLSAAQRLGVDVTVASEQPSTLEHLNPSALLTLDFQDLQGAAARVREFSREWPIDAVVPVDSQVVVVAATIAARLGLRHNSVESAAAAENKHRMRQLFEQAGVASPRFTLCRLDEDRADLAARVEYPCVVKPLSLAASQGVMRADDPEQFIAMVDRLAAILACQDGEPASEFLVEQFVEGPEVALEGILTRSSLRVLALFDKPDPLDGPFFEETIYLAPSGLADEVQQAVASSVQQAASALGLTDGPVHAELRLTGDGPVVLEVHGRSIGGLCSRLLKFGSGLSLEELIIRHAMDQEFDLPDRQSQAAGVMMIPIPAAGRLEEIRGLENAREVIGIDDLTITAHLGQQLVPLPEGSQYLGFLFARAEEPGEVEQALRQAHRQLEFVIES
jgi:biotin carboxylase